MKHKLKIMLAKHFAGIETDYSDIIRAAYAMQDELTQKVIKHYANGGNGKMAPCLFFISESAYYKRLRNFATVIETVAVIEGRK